MVFPKNGSKITQILLHFLIHINVVKLCRKFELIPNSSYAHFTKTPKFSKNTQGYIKYQKYLIHTHNVSIGQCTIIIIMFVNG